MTIDHHGRAIDGLDYLFRHDKAGMADGLDLPFLEQGDPVAVKRGEVDVMRDGNHRQALFAVQGLQQVEEIGLMTDVQVSGRFVQKQDVRFLGQGAGDQHPVELAAAQAVHPAVREVQDVRLFHGSFHCRQVRRPFEAPSAQVRRPAHEHDFTNREGKNRRRGLGDHGDDFREVVALHFPDRRAIEADRSPIRLEKAVDQFQERGLAGSVGADQSQKIALFHAEPDIRKDREPVVGKGDLIDLQDVHLQKALRCSR
ncbi:MAG TPA: hypothetical protein PK425_02995 [Syntrophales bacterium]|nr:hypothetical protein [Syntrophales bacterium]